MTSVYVAYTYGDELLGCEPTAKILGVFADKVKAFKVFIPEIVTDLINTLRIEEYDLLEDEDRDHILGVLEDTVQHMESCWHSGTWNTCHLCKQMQHDQRLKQYYDLVDDLWVNGSCILDVNWSCNYQSFHIQESVYHEPQLDLNLDKLNLN